jgi:hypothetical protein
MARTRKSGKRTAKGRLSRAKLALTERNPPNAAVIARRERFRHFRGDGSIGLEMTCAGRLMLVGVFDGMEVPAETLLDELLRYSNAYWGHYGALAPALGSYEPRSRTSGDGANGDPAGKWFDVRDAMLRNAGHAARQAVHDVTVDRHFFPDEDAGWAARIINARIDAKRMALRKANRPVPEELRVIGELACDSDWAMVSLLRDGAMALAGVAKKCAA